MGIIEDIKKMQMEGRPDQEIIGALQAQGHQAAEITEALAQTKIKNAVSDNGPSEGIPARVTGSDSGAEASTRGMQPSMMNATSPPAPQPATPEVVGGHYAPETTPEQTYADYGYQEYAPQSSASADTIAEIAEQVVAEKMQDLRQTLEKVIEFRSTVEAKTNYLDSRLQRIERIIDQLQQSILQRVGEHMTAVSDLKDELIETQKSFKSLLPEARHRLPHLSEKAPKTEE